MLTHIGTQKIETKRLILRPFEYSDSEDMLAFWAADEKVQSLYSEPVYSTEKEARQFLDKYISSYKRKDFYCWAIIEKDSGHCIGQLAFFLVDSKNHFGEIEYCIGRKFQRNGFATQAVNAIIRFGFSKINFHKIQVCHKDFNMASKGVTKKCGFTYEGTLRDFFLMNRKYVDRLYYSMLKSEWKNK